MIRSRAAAAEIDTKVGNHTFRSTGITAYLKNGATGKGEPRLDTDDAALRSTVGRGDARRGRAGVNLAERLAH